MDKKWIIGGAVVVGVLVFLHYRNAAAADALMAGPKVPVLPPQQPAPQLPQGAVQPKPDPIITLSDNPRPTTVPVPVSARVQVNAILRSGNQSLITVLITGGDSYNGYTGVVDIEGIAYGEKGRVLQVYEINLMPFLKSDPSGQPIFDSNGQPSIAYYY